VRRIPTWLLFISLVVASFAPIVILEAGWWVPFYYGALLAWWVSVALLRSEGLATAAVPRQPTGRPRPAWNGRTGDPAADAASPVRPVLTEPRLIIVARGHGELYDRLRQDRMGDDSVRIIPDRRGADRRRRLQVYIPERRLTERRRFDVSPLLVTRGWAQVPLPRS
jgi:hypothetical protein